MKEINIKIPASPEITESASFVMLGDGFDEIGHLHPLMSCDVQGCRSLPFP